LLSLIESAKKELLIVSFAVYQESRWLRALEQAVERDVAVTFFVETTSSGKIDFQGLSSISQRLLTGCRVLTWDTSRRPANAKGQSGTLHAKCAVSDHSTVFISSANLTPHALELNIEIGVQIAGGNLPPRIVQMFEDLFKRGDLVPMSQPEASETIWRRLGDHEN
jgi:phosphatidylserine/phosphatidylglycerophosphate/cardiolipin synthase-like enzyme